jgi:CHASE3 domain sensor protein
MKKLIPIYGLITLNCMVLVVFLYSFISIYSGITQSLKFGQNKYDFLVSTNSIKENLKNAESAQRGYLITGNKLYLESFKNSKYRLKLEKDRFTRMFHIDGLNKKNEVELVDIDKLIDQKIAEMDTTIMLYNSANNTAAIRLVKSDIGINFMNKLDAIIQKLNAEQKYKETQAKQEVLKNRKVLKYLSIGTVLFSLISFFLLGFYIKSLAKLAKV